MFFTKNVLKIGSLKKRVVLDVERKQLRMILSNLPTIIKIYVRDIYNFKIVLEKVKTCDTISVIKHMIEMTRGIPVDQQRLVYKGQLLEDERTIAYYNICNNSIIDSVMRMVC
uniref:Ubiquitin-like domain-containing protein n=1 Tax=Meloidogyne enterolobii TaxID=390850 RepID=A0A6V7WBM1_MELEN|nr:unnamed protein product [Meloidogyne enterolobii]